MCKLFFNHHFSVWQANQLEENTQVPEGLSVVEDEASTEEALEGQSRTLYMQLEILETYGSKLRRWKNLIKACEKRGHKSVR